MTKKVEITLTNEELELLNQDRKGSSLVSYIKKLALENTPSARSKPPKPQRVKGEISKSGLPYVGHTATDEELDDPEMVQRLLDFKKNPPKESDLIPWAEVKRGLTERQKVKP